MDFSERRPEEVISFFWRSVYNEMAMSSLRQANIVWHGFYRMALFECVTEAWDYIILIYFQKLLTYFNFDSEWDSRSRTMGKSRWTR